MIPSFDSIFVGFQNVFFPPCFIEILLDLATNTDVSNFNCEKVT